MTLTTEQVLTSPAGFNLRTATPAQRAACRIIDGLPLDDLASHPDVVALVGGEAAIAALPTCQCSQVAFLAAIRSAKTLISLSVAIAATQKVDCSGLVVGEIPRISIVSVRLDSANAGFGILRETVRSSPALRSLLVGDPTADSLMLRHPSGRPIEICCVAGAKAGATLVSRWSAGAIFDEAPRMCGQEESVINLDDAKSAVLGRLLPGAQALYVGSPWAPFGPVYAMVQQYWGKPSEALVVLRGNGPMLNPTWWTPERCRKLEKTDPTAHRTDVLAEFADPETSLFTSTALEAATNPNLVIDSAWSFRAAMDPATRGNSWTLVIVARKPRPPGLALSERYQPTFAIAAACQWTGSKSAPLSPDATIEQVARVCQMFGVRSVVSDQWMIDSVIELAAKHNLYVERRDPTMAEKVSLYEELRLTIEAGRFELSDVKELKSDLLRVKKKVTQQGMSIELPRTADGRHCDFAPALALAFEAALAGYDDGSTLDPDLCIIPDGTQFGRGRGY